MKTIIIYRIWHYIMFPALALLLYGTYFLDLGYFFLIALFFQGVFQIVLGFVALISPIVLGLSSRKSPYAWLGLSALYVLVVYLVTALPLDTGETFMQVILVGLPILIALFQYLTFTKKVNLEQVS